jgi:hypothetical protein
LYGPEECTKPSWNEHTFLVLSADWDQSGHDASDQSISKILVVRSKFTDLALFFTLDNLQDVDELN